MKIWKYILMATLLISIFMLVACDNLSPDNDSEWDVITFGRGGSYECQAIEIGALKGDGVERIYLIQSNIYSVPTKIQVLEYSYEQGKWQESIIYTHYFSTYDWSVSMIIAQARNDGIDRIYMNRGSGSGRILWELWYSEGMWDSLNINNDSYLISDFTVGTARNDGIQRIYGCGYNGGILEYTFSNNQWEITSVGPSGSLYFESISIGKARHDGVYRIYAAGSNGHIYELSYTGSSWVMSDLGSVRNSQYGNLIHIAVGPGRSDGWDRIYAGIEYFSTVHEFNYQAGGFWEIDTTMSGGCGCEGLAIGPGRNDGMMRVYKAGNFNNLVEFSYINNNWDLTTSFEGGPSFTGVIIGPGRGDQINRVYGICNDGYVYEYSYKH